MLIACFTVFPADAADTIKSNTVIAATSFHHSLPPILPSYLSDKQRPKSSPKPHPCGIYHHLAAKFTSHRKIKLIFHVSLISDLSKTCLIYEANLALK